MYGRDRVYVDLVARALELWSARQRDWQRELFHRTGVLWMFNGDDEYARVSIPLLTEVGARIDELTVREAAARFPQIDFGGVQSVFFERDAGILRARDACRAVCDAVCAGGGTYVEGLVEAVRPEMGRMSEIATSDGRTLTGDLYVFACGAWLGTLLPDLLGNSILATKQEVYYFGTPPSDGRSAGFPVWIDFGDRIRYGVPSQGSIKVADDTRGVAFDPTGDDRMATSEGLSSIRTFLERRVPQLARAPVLETRVCPYENSPDGHLIVDRHPAAQNAWVVGGGSGHGFKLGPAVGEYVADCVLDERVPYPEFSFDRFRTISHRATQFELGSRR